MMWFCCVLFSFGGCTALRLSQPSEGDRHYTVQLALKLTDPEKIVGGTPIHIAVNGVRRVSKLYSTEEGEPIVLPHLAKGSVVTAHVQTYDACAYWVTPGSTHHTVGEWELSFTTLAEGQEGHISDKVYEAYVTIVGWGPLVSIEVDNDHESIKTLDSVKSHETFVYPGLRKGALVKVWSDSGDTCTSRVGNEELECNLDKTWGLKIGSVMETGENTDDEGANYTQGTTTTYTMELTLSRDSDSARKLEIGLNGHQIAEKLTATEAGETILVKHVKSGSVITAVAHDKGEACTMFIGIGALTKTCAGWTLNLDTQEEIEGSTKREIFDVSFSVHHGFTKPRTKWGVLVDGIYKAYSNNPMLFPRTVSGVARNTPVTATVETALVPGCIHTVGEQSTACEHGGWNFTIFSQLNTNHWLDGDYFDWDDEDEDYDRATYDIRVRATDSTLSDETTLECVARQDLTFSIEDKTIKHISNNTRLFKPINLTPIQIADGKTVNSAIFVATFKAKYPIFSGFYCTIYRVESIMCEADTHDASWTYQPGFTLEVDLV